MGIGDRLFDNKSIFLPSIKNDFLPNNPKKIPFFLPVGIVASGKTTLREHIRKDYPCLLVISTDEIRFKILDYQHTGMDFYAPIEKYIWNQAYSLIRIFQEQNKPIFFDATNLKQDKRSLIISRVDKTKYEIIILHIHIHPRLCILRNAKRSRSVPLDIIKKQIQGYESPKRSEGKIIHIYNKPTMAEKDQLKHIKIYENEVKWN